MCFLKSIAIRFKAAELAKRFDERTRAYYIMRYQVPFAPEKMFA
jgi:hypothetical protein